MREAGDRRKKELFASKLRAIMKAPFILAMLDSDIPDDLTLHIDPSIAFDIGYARALGSKIVAFRREQPESIPFTLVYSIDLFVFGWRNLDHFLAKMRKGYFDSVRRTYGDGYGGEIR